MEINPDEIRLLYWQEKCSVCEIAKKLDISTWALYDFMRRNDIPRRSPSDVSFVNNKNKPRFQLKTELTATERTLQIAGIMLYWAEGTFRGNTVDFANSNPEMVRLFLKFLRIICGISEQRLRVYLYGYSSHNLDSLKKYWHSVTGIPLNQFTKPYIRRDSPNLSKRKLRHGLVHIRYNDKKLLWIIRSWIEEYIRESWAGTQVAKGDRLSKGSVMPKGMMEKQVNSGKPLG